MEALLYKKKAPGRSRELSFVDFGVFIKNAEITRFYY